MKHVLLVLAAVGLVGCGAATSVDETPTDIVETTPQKSDEVATEPVATPPVNVPPAEVVEPKVVSLTEFFDFNCGYCRRAGQTMQQLRANYGEQLDFTLKHNNIYPASRPAHVGAACAAEQGMDAFIAFHDTFFESYYGKTNKKTARVIAEDVSLNMAEYDACVASGRPEKTIEQDSALAVALGARGTPFFVLDGELPIRGAIPYESFAAQIDYRLK